MKSPARLGEILVERGALTAPQLDAALCEQQRCGERLGQVLVRLGILEREELSNALAEQTRRWVAAGLTAGILAFQPGCVMARTVTAQLTVSVEVLNPAVVAVQPAQAGAVNAAPGNLSLSCGGEPLMRVTYQRAHIEPQAIDATAASSPYVPAPSPYKLRLQPLSQSLVSCGSAGQSVGLTVPAVALQGDDMNIEIAY